MPILTSQHERKCRNRSIPRLIGIPTLLIPLCWILVLPLLEPYTVYTPWTDCAIQGFRDPPEGTEVDDTSRAGLTIPSAETDAGGMGLSSFETTSSFQRIDLCPDRTPNTEYNAWYMRAGNWVWGVRE